MQGHAEERRATVLFFLSVARHAALAEAKWGVLCQDRESKLHDQVAELEACVAQLRLQFSAIQTTESAALAASLPPHPNSRASTVYLSHTCVR
jgi:hypothetical protein